MWGISDSQDITQKRKKRWEFRREYCRKDAAARRSLYIHRESERPEHFPGKCRIPIACPLCDKTFSVRIELLMRLELPPQQGNRDAEICPKLDASGPPKQKWIQLLLRIKGNMPELRLYPKKVPYQLQPIARMKPKGRLRMEELKKSRRRSRTPQEKKNRNKANRRCENNSSKSTERRRPMAKRRG